MNKEPVLETMEHEMIIRNLSRKTVRSYLFHARRLSSFTGKPMQETTSDDVRKYVRYHFSPDGSNFSAVRQALSAFHFLFNIVLGKDVMVNVPYPKKERKLPIILSREEVSRLLSSSANSKHSLLLKLIYSCGLRVSESVKIKTTDIDLPDRTLHIRQGKGKRDRIVPIPISLAPELNEFIEPRDRNPYLFKSRNGRNTHISVQSAQLIFRKARIRSGIRKDIHPHSLRHSFATHLLDQGTDIRYIQEFLGHKRITTTELYTQVSKVSLKGIRNPLDQLGETK